MASIPDETTILNFRHLLEKHDIAADALEAVNLLLADQGITVRKGTIIEAPSSTKNAAGARDPEMHQTKKGNQWHFGMKAHIGVDMTGLVHTVVGTAANVHDVTQAHALLHGEEELVLGDAGYRGVQGRKSRGKPESQRAVAHCHASGQTPCAGQEQHGADAGVLRTSQGQPALAGGASVSGDQMPVWIYQGALSGAGQEHGAAEDAVYVGKPVEGAPPFDGYGGIGAPEMGVEGPKTASCQGGNHPDSGLFLSKSSAL